MHWIVAALLSHCTDAATLCGLFHVRRRVVEVLRLGKGEKQKDASCEARLVIISIHLLWLKRVCLHACPQILGRP